MPLPLRFVAFLNYTERNSLYETKLATVVLIPLRIGSTLSITVVTDLLVTKESNSLVCRAYDGIPKSPH